MIGDQERPALTGNHGRHLAIPAERLEEYGWGMIDWRDLPSHVSIYLLRVADRVAREGHAVAFTGRDYPTGAEMKIDGRITTVRYLGSEHASLLITPGVASSTSVLLACLLADTRDNPARLVVVCDSPDIGERDARDAVTSLRERPRLAGIEDLDIYGHGWAVHSRQP
jgi:hypothetical protein